MSTPSPFFHANSPFFEKRFEREPTHVFFLPQPVFGDLEKATPTYVIGSRGTGKTTLLQALNWSERINNQALQRQLGQEGAKWKYLGVYLKLPEFHLTALERWLDPAGAALREAAIAMYFELLWFELLIDGVSELVLGRHLRAKATDERELVCSLLASHRQSRPGSHDFLAVGEPVTLKELGALIREHRQILDRGALWQVDPMYLLKGYPVEQIGLLTRTLGPVLAAFCDGHARGGSSNWHFKVCMDEGECLSPLQLRAINTIVRLSKRPIFPVLSFVACPKDIQATLLPNLTLGDADRQLILLEDKKYMSDAIFRQFADGVASVRVQNDLKDPTACIYLPKCLGPLDINGLLLGILRTSESKEARDLLHRAERIRGLEFFATTGPEPDEEEDEGLDCRVSDAPPIYQAYLIDRLGISLPAPDEPRWARRAQDSAELRKRMVAAYLAICYDFNANPRYASARMVYQMSDRCIRDFLLIANEIFLAAQVPLRDFITRTVPHDVQDRALHSASRKKRDAVSRSPVSDPTEVGRMIHGLGLITSIIQREGEGQRNLRSSERGEFTVSISGLSASRTRPVLELIQDASEAGFLRVLEASDRQWRFRVHTSLAAEYSFSYRGAQYPVGIGIDDLESLRETKDLGELERVARKIGRRLAGNDDTAPLFEGGGAQ